MYASFDESTAMPYTYLNGFAGLLLRHQPRSVFNLVAGHRIAILFIEIVYSAFI